MREISFNLLKVFWYERLLEFIKSVEYLFNIKGVTLLESFKVYENN